MSEFLTNAMSEGELRARMRVLCRKLSLAPDVAAEAQKWMMERARRGPGEWWSGEQGAAPLVGPDDPTVTPAINICGNDAPKVSGRFSVKVFRYLWWAVLDSNQRPTD